MTKSIVETEKVLKICKTLEQLESAIPEKTTSKTTPTFSRPTWLVKIPHCVKRACVATATASMAKRSAEILQGSTNGVIS